MNRRVACLTVLLCFVWSFEAVAAGNCCPGDAAATRGAVAGVAHASHADHAADDEGAPPPCHCLAGSCTGSAPAHPTVALALRQFAEVHAPDFPPTVSLAETPGARLLPWSMPPPTVVV
jgi:hypothetical protein